MEQPKDSTAIQLVGPDGHVRPMKEIERATIAFAIRRYGNHSEAARRLEIGRSTIYRKLPTTDPKGKD